LPRRTRRDFTKPAQTRARASERGAQISSPNPTDALDDGLRLRITIMILWSFDCSPLICALRTASWDASTAMRHRHDRARLETLGKAEGHAGPPVRGLSMPIHACTHTSCIHSRHTECVSESEQQRSERESKRSEPINTDDVLFLDDAPSLGSISTPTICILPALR
jgi:hypothetical protein